MKELINSPLNRRKFVTGVAAGGLLYGLGGFSNSFANTQAKAKFHHHPTLKGKQFSLDIGYMPVNFTGKQRLATAVNGSVPCPTLYWQEGDEVTLRVSNKLKHSSSIHWHGIILDTQMDGVPGLSFDGIDAGKTFVYKFKVNQSGTYWYHSHSGFQEQTGMYGAIVIYPKEPDPVSYDREHVIVLSDWSDEKPEKIYRKLKKMSDYYNFRERTSLDLFEEIKSKGVKQTYKDRKMWNKMRMSDRDLSDVTGYTYTYLMNGITPDEGWKGKFKKGEKVRLRIINASAMTLFDIRIPGLKMKVVAADGQNIEPVTVDEFRMGVAETYDVIIEPKEDSAYTIFAQSIDRTGFTRGTLTPSAELIAQVPAMDPPPLLGMRDMGMAGMMNMKGMDMKNMSMTSMDRKGMNMNHSKMKGMDHAKMSGMQVSHDEMKTSGKAGFGSQTKPTHVKTEFGPHVDMRAMSPQSGLNDPGIGLRNNMKLYGRKVLTYADICGLAETEDKRDPSREIELHLTGNMSRYMWSINGIKFADAEPIQLKYGERVRITIFNDTMMTHPIHLHGMWSELETNEPKYIPKKHTINVQPGSKISYLVTADARGRWAYHCHLLYHMPGMFREVRVS